MAAAVSTAAFMGHTGDAAVKPWTTVGNDVHGDVVPVTVALPPVPAFPVIVFRPVESIAKRAWSKREKEQNGSSSKRNIGSTVCTTD